MYWITARVEVVVLQDPIKLFGSILSKCLDKQLQNKLPEVNWALTLGNFALVSS